MDCHDWNLIFCGVLTGEVNRQNSRRHVSGASFSCLLCKTWTSFWWQVYGDQFLVTSNLGGELGSCAIVSNFLVNLCPSLEDELHAKSQIMLPLHDFMNGHILHQGQNSLVWSKPCFLPTNLADLGPCSRLMCKKTLPTTNHHKEQKLQNSQHNQQNT